MSTGGAQPRKRGRSTYALACTECARSKRKCDGSRPCQRCARMNLSCEDPTERRKRGRKSKSEKKWQHLHQQQEDKNGSCHMKLSKSRSSAVTNQTISENGSFTMPNSTVSSTMHNVPLEYLSVHGLGAYGSSPEVFWHTTCASSTVPVHSHVLSTTGNVPFRTFQQPIHDTRTNPISSDDNVPHVSETSLTNHSFTPNIYASAVPTQSLLSSQIRSDSHESFNRCIYQPSNTTYVVPPLTWMSQANGTPSFIPVSAVRSSENGSIIFPVGTSPAFVSSPYPSMPGMNQYIPNSSTFSQNGYHEQSNQLRNLSGQQFATNFVNHTHNNPQPASFTEECTPCGLDVISEAASQCAPATLDETNEYLRAKKSNQSNGDVRGHTTGANGTAEYGNMHGTQQARDAHTVPTTTNYAASYSNVDTIKSTDMSATFAAQMGILGYHEVNKLQQEQVRINMPHNKRNRPDEHNLKSEHSSKAMKSDIYDTNKSQDPERHSDDPSCQPCLLNYDSTTSLSFCRQLKTPIDIRPQSRAFALAAARAWESVSLFGETLADDALPNFYDFVRDFYLQASKSINPQVEQAQEFAITEAKFRASQLRIKQSKYKCMLSEYNESDTSIPTPPIPSRILSMEQESSLRSESQYRDCVLEAIAASNVPCLRIGYCPRTGEPVSIRFNKSASKLFGYSTSDIEACLAEGKPIVWVHPDSIESRAVSAVAASHALTTQHAYNGRFVKLCSGSLKNPLHAKFASFYATELVSYQRSLQDPRVVTDVIIHFTHVRPCDELLDAHAKHRLVENAKAQSYLLSAVNHFERLWPTLATDASGDKSNECIQSIFGTTQLQPFPILPVRTGVLRKLARLGIASKALLRFFRTFETALRRVSQSRLSGDFNSSIGIECMTDGANTTDPKRSSTASLSPSEHLLTDSMVPRTPSALTDFDNLSDSALRPQMSSFPYESPHMWSASKANISTNTSTDNDDGVLSTDVKAESDSATSVSLDNSEYMHFHKGSEFQFYPGLDAKDVASAAKYAAAKELSLNDEIMTGAHAEGNPHTILRAPSKVGYTLSTCACGYVDRQSSNLLDCGDLRQWNVRPGTLPAGFAVIARRVYDCSGADRVTNISMIQT